MEVRHHGRGRSLVPSRGPEDVPGPVLRPGHSLPCGPCAWTCPVAARSLGCSVDGSWAGSCSRGAGPVLRESPAMASASQLLSHIQTLRLFPMLVIVRGTYGWRVEMTK